MNAGSESIKGVGKLHEKEKPEEQLLRLSGHAGNVLNMFKAFFNTPKGIDIRRALIFTAALAGHACHQAVKAEKGSFAVVTTEDGKRFHFGDDLNRYLLEDSLSVVNIIFAVSDISQDDVLSIVAGFAKQVGSEDLSVCGYAPKSLYKQVNSCWEGIFDNMTSQYCKSPAEWPILYGIVLQNIMLTAIDAGAPKDEVGKIAVECTVAVSKMDKDSF